MVGLPEDKPDEGVVKEDKPSFGAAALPSYFDTGLMGCTVSREQKRS